MAVLTTLVNGIPGKIRSAVIAESTTDENGDITLGKVTWNDYVPSDAVPAGMANEIVIKFIYNSITGISGISVYEMLQDQLFIDYIDDSNIIDDFHTLRKARNVVLHDNVDFSEEESLELLEKLYLIVSIFAVKIGLIDVFPDFVRPALNTRPSQVNVTDSEIDEQVVSKYATRLKNVHFTEDLEKNIQSFINGSLSQAEFPITTPIGKVAPSSACLNVIINGVTFDRLLYNSAQQPIAVIVEKRSDETLFEAKERGIEKVNILNQMGYSPILYYIINFTIMCLDFNGYEPRRVLSFHSEKEIMTLIQRRNDRSPISDVLPDSRIIDRPYQIEVVKSMMNAFSSYRRRSLIILATGSGKTRVSIAAIKLLMEKRWIKNVLFLADRKSLVQQARDSFSKFLPSCTSSEFTGDSLEKDINANLVFSTYNTMAKCISGPTKIFGIGRFDIIIIDEAHRSIFTKYKRIFDYFDSLMIGLTATPRCEESKSTYKIFDLPNYMPDYEYNLEKAVEEGWLVSFSVENVETILNRNGIKYDDLSDEEKEKLDEEFGEDNYELNKFKDAGKIDLNGHVVNSGTIDKMLNYLMTKGLKIEGNNKIGKTIIFSKY